MLKYRIDIITNDARIVNYATNLSSINAMLAVNDLLLDGDESYLSYVDLTHDDVNHIRVIPLESSNGDA